MIRVSFFRIAIVVFMYCIAFSSHAQVKTKSLNKKKWVHVETENFNIYSDVSAKKAKLTAQQLERYRAFCELFLKSATEVNQSKLTLFVTDKASTWRAMGLGRDYVSVYTRHTGGSSYLFANMKGFFGTSFREANPGRSVVLNSIAGELFHNIGLDSSYPYWFRTGFGYYLATYSEPKDSIMLGSLDAYGNRLYSVFNPAGGVISFDSQALFARSKKDERAPSMGRNLWHRKVNRIYMESFLAVHYLYADENRRKQMKDYIARVLAGEDKGLAFESAFSMTHSEFDSALRTYVTARKMKARVFNKEQITKLLALPVNYQVTRIDSAQFLQNFARGINELGERSISNEHRSKLVQDLRILYPEVFKPEQSL